MIVVAGRMKHVLLARTGSALRGRELLIIPSQASGSHYKDVLHVFCLRANVWDTCASCATFLRIKA